MERGGPFTLLVSGSGEVLYRKEGQIDAIEVKRIIVKNMKDLRFEKKKEK